ncbi:MAG: sensor histidine kinase, partial [Halobacteriota archaeon]
HRPETYAEAAEKMMAGETWVGDFEATTKDGRLIYGSGTATPLSVDGETWGYVAVFTDLTRHRQYEQSLRILNRVLRHNLRNDANVILGHLNDVAGNVDDDLERPIEAATERVESMLHRADTTREFSGVLTSENEEGLRPTRLDTAVERAIARVTTSDVDMTVDLDDESVSVVADETLSAALEAVVENAVVHNDKETPLVEIRARNRDDRLVLTVADNGPGIEPYRRDRIFGREETTKVHHGQGLSLFFVDRLMEIYGGSVSVTDNDPEGTVFELRFRTASQDVA